MNIKKCFLLRGNVMKLLKYTALTFIILLLTSKVTVAAQDTSLIFTQEEIKLLNDAYDEAQKGNIEAVEKFFDEENDLLEKLRYLFIAANQGNFDAVREFIESGGNVNIPPPRNEQMQFIFYAIEKNNLEMVMYLVEKGANVNHVRYMDNYIMSPLSIALRVASGAQSLDIIDYLRSKGAKLLKDLISEDLKE